VGNPEEAIAETITVTLAVPLGVTIVGNPEEAIAETIAVTLAAGTIAVVLAVPLEEAIAVVPQKKPTQNTVPDVGVVTTVTKAHLKAGVTAIVNREVVARVIANQSLLEGVQVTENLRNTQLLVIPVLVTRLPQNHPQGKKATNLHPRHPNRLPSQLPDTNKSLNLPQQRSHQHLQLPEKSLHQQM
jgi:hypothetical protein